MRRISVGIILFLVIAIGGGGGGGSDDSHTPMGTLSVDVVDAIDDTPINDASITVYDSSNILVTRDLSFDGSFEYSLSPGTYIITVAAQDYLPVPLSNQSAIPFEIIDGETTIQTVAMEEHPDAGTTGQISGYTLTPDPDFLGISGVLVVAKDDSLDLHASAITGPDGDYVIYNAPPGNYTLEAYLAGYREISEPVTVDVVAADEYFADEIEMEVHANADLYGKVTFLAIVNGVVDITLVHPDTLDVIPGLSTQNQDSELTYQLDSVPPGTYIAWASYRNDDYVMDPDSIRKSGLPKVEFTESSGDLEKNFDVTGAVTIDSPTNEPDLVVPVEVNTASPTFTWIKYPSAKEYIVEVFDSSGETIWGGFNDLGEIQHTQIGQEETSAVFNFDESATAQLQDGEVYRWKIYADSDALQNVQGLISSSEDQMGIFKYIDNSP